MALGSLLYRHVLISAFFLLMNGILYAEDLGFLDCRVSYLIGGTNVDPDNACSATPIKISTITEEPGGPTISFHQARVQIKNPEFSIDAKLDLGGFKLQLNPAVGKGPIITSNESGLNMNGISILQSADGLIFHGKSISSVYAICKIITKNGPFKPCTIKR